MMALDAALDTAAVRAAHQAFVELLKSEAEHQHAYVAEWPDGRVSLELEGADFRSIIQAVIKAYLAATAGIPTLSRDEAPLLDH